MKFIRLLVFSSFNVCGQQESNPGQLIRDALTRYPNTPLKQQQQETELLDYTYCKYVTQTTKWKLTSNKPE